MAVFRRTETERRVGGVDDSQSKLSCCEGQQSANGLATAQTGLFVGGRGAGPRLGSGSQLVSKSLQQSEIFFTTLGILNDSSLRQLSNIIAKNVKYNIYESYFQV